MDIHGDNPPSHIHKQHQDVYPTPWPSGGHQPTQSHNGSHPAAHGGTTREALAAGKPRDAAANALPRFTPRHDMFMSISVMRVRLKRVDHLANNAIHHISNHEAIARRPRGGDAQRLLT
jgi:hypothetical protein